MTATKLLRTLITNNNEVQALLDTIKPTDTIAIDLECENNLHRYGVFCCLIQVQHDTTYLIDALSVDKELVKQLFLHPCTKLFHDVTFDFRVIQHEYGCVPVNHKDTQLAAMLIAEEKLGYGSLVEKYLGVTIDKHGQRADWSQRPLPKNLLDYAALDVVYLEALYNKLLEKLGDKVAWLNEECAYRETVNWPLHVPHWTDLKHLGTLTQRQLYKAQYLWTERERIAKELDKPSYKIISNKNIIRCVEGERVPANKLMIPLLKRWPGTGEMLPEKEHVKYDLKELKELRNTKAEQHHVTPDILFPLADMRAYALGNNTLREWQKKVLYP